MNASRRDIFKKAALGLTGVAGMAALSGCASLGIGAPQTPAQGTADVQLLASGMTAVLAALSTVPGVPADVLAKVQAEVALIQAQAAVVGNAIVPQPSVIAQIGAAVSAISALLAPFFPAAGGIALVIKAALALLASFGVTAGHDVITPDQARTVLRDAPSIVRVH